MKIHSRGKYKDIIDPTHPYADKKGRVALHRYVLEQKLGRYLFPFEVAHHIDENVNNNEPSNIELTNLSDHSRKHKTTGISFAEFICEKCGNKFKREKRNVKKGRKFCSRSCASSLIGNHAEKPIKHGTQSGYRKGCRCSGCKAAQSIRMSKYWSSHPPTICKVNGR